MIVIRLTREQADALVGLMNQLAGAENWRMLLPIYDEFQRAMKSEEPKVKVAK